MPPSRKLEFSHIILYIQFNANRSIRMSAIMVQTLLLVEAASFHCCKDFVKACLQWQEVELAS